MTKIKQIGSSNLFLIAIGLYTLATILGLADVFLSLAWDTPLGALGSFAGVFGGILGAVLAAVPIIALWLIFDGAKFEQNPNLSGQKVLTALKMSQVYIIITICLLSVVVVFGLLGLALLGLAGNALGEVAGLPPGYFPITAALIVVGSGISILWHVLALGIIKNLRNNIYSGNFQPLPATGLFTAIVGFDIALGFSMLFITPNLLTNLGMDAQLIEMFTTHLPMGHLGIGTFATLATILSLSLFLVLLHKFNNNTEGA
ncbi:MAG: hypothetical protein FWE21_01860 [Defluviitaleaceae bacterium]|nr:hypothetical protein [Defluviitaleaceae bacterium]